MEHIPQSENEIQRERNETHREPSAVAMPRRTIESSRQTTDQFPPEPPTPNTTGAPAFLGQSGGRPAPNSQPVTPNNSGLPPNEPRPGGNMRSDRQRPSAVAQQVTRRAKEQVKTTSREKASEVAELAERKKDELQSASYDAAETGRRRVTSRLRKFENLCEDACATLEERDEPELAKAGAYVNGQLRRVAEYVERRDARQIADDAVGFAQRNPTLVVGTALAAGFLVGRAGMASARRNAEGGGER